jgi:hypothetical protein
MITFADIGLVLLGALLGIGSSGVFWWVQNHYWVPRIEFSDEIAHYEVDDAAGYFRVKFRNAGKRSIIDVQVIVRVSVYKLGRRPMWTNFNVSHNTETVPLLGKTGEKIINLMHDRDGVAIQGSVSDFVSKKISEVQSLHDLLSLGERTRLRVFVLGYDRFSGARKLFKSKDYDVFSIRKGVFNDMNVVAPGWED